MSTDKTFTRPSVEPLMDSSYVEHNFSDGQTLSDVQKKNSDAVFVLLQFTMFALREYPNQLNGFRITALKERLSLLQMKSLNRCRIKPQ